MQGYETTTWPQLYSVECEFSTIYRQLQTNKLSTANYFLKDTLIYKLRKLYVLTGDHQQNFIWEMHYSKMVGHFGVVKTLFILQKYFYWTTLKSNVNKYIRSCMVCAITKPLNRRQGLYMPFPFPSRSWKYVDKESLVLICFQRVFQKMLTNMESL